MFKEIYKVIYFIIIFLFIYLLFTIYFSEENIKITGIVSVMRAGTTNSRIRGSIWGR